MIAIVYPQFYGVGGIARYLDSFLSNLPPDHPPGGQAQVAAVEVPKIDHVAPHGTINGAMRPQRQGK